MSDDTYKIERAKCAPGVKYDGRTCFSLKSLQKIAESYNKNYNEKIKITSDKFALLNNLTKKLRNTCKDDQHCWLKQKFSKT